MNTPPSAKQLKDTAQEVHTLTRQAIDYAGVGDYRRAHAAAERAQGAARRLKELLQGRRETTRHMRASLTGSGPGQAGERASARTLAADPPAQPRPRSPLR